MQGTIRWLLEQVVSRVTDGQFLGVGDGKPTGAPRLSVGQAATPEDACRFPPVARTCVDGFERVPKAVGPDRGDGDRDVGYWRTADTEKTPSRESRHASVICRALVDTVPEQVPVEVRPEPYRAL